jgi:hypothetical protein
LSGESPLLSGLGGLGSLDVAGPYMVRSYTDRLRTVYINTYIEERERDDA